MTTATMPEWMDTAACRQPGYDPEWWFGLDGSPEEAAARQVCAGCPVRGRCLSWARALGCDHGIFGGLTAVERRGGPRMGRPRGYTLLDVERTRDLAGDGHTDRQISDVLGIPVGTVNGIRRRHGIPPGRSAGRPRGGAATSDQLSAVIADDRTGRSVRDTARRLGINIRTVYRWRRELRQAGRMP